MIDPKKLTTTANSRRLVLIRSQGGSKQELGALFVFDGPRKIYEAVTLQKVGIVQDGTFSIRPYLSPKSRKMTLLLSGTPGHSYVEIHVGNYLSDTNGCILPGKTFLDMDKDGLLDVSDSKIKMDELLALIITETTITVKTIPE